MLKKRFPFPEGCSIQSIVIREITGEDEVKAAQLAAATAEGVGVFTATLDEKIRLSIVMVDDKTVDQPYLPYNNWTAKTRAYVTSGYHSINGAGNTDGFLAGGTIEA